MIQDGSYETALSGILGFGLSFHIVDNIKVVRLVNNNNSLGNSRRS